ncbi:reverse transcriptase domain-containing protein [Maridesulfovibrio salexigens]|uniref:Prophage PSPPH06, putative reverse transcriptase/maturase n=1 Tax=Maridesulfovibrio salexigens (strain ATCC 14822 / DSM 2638 / NCIMB 8403 / VKM B-1763) TaxID=526222 RepID=C6BRH7_MARSD|nr:reverse transcriptase domain-containing protein [Maridesulfovibrio salexigens]ACS79417.1 prophage PSPPH06, putative reverse transcriptase/maturase [Maridesulfovibrio salexigens DSM 2638]
MEISQQLKEMFSLEHIEQVYEERVRLKSGRGIDRVSVVDFDKRKDEYFNNIHVKCLNGTYKFSPYLQKLILKGPESFPRKISIPTVRDKIVLSILNSIIQEIFPHCVNRELPNVKVRNLKNVIATCNCDYEFHRVDIKSYYDNIDIEQLFGILNGNIDDELLLLLLHRAVINPTVPQNYSRSEKSKYANKDKGVPQGLPISNVLAEIYLLDFDEYMNDKCKFYDRYVDDIVALALPIVDFEKSCEDKFKIKNLPLNTDKTKFCCEVSEVNYLGYAIEGDLVTVKRRTLERHFYSIAMMFSRLRKAIFMDNKRKDKGIGADEIKNAFVEDLNVKLTGAKFHNKRYGWLQYYSEINDLEIPYVIDNFVAQQFYRCEHFTKLPNSLKKVSRAYYELKYNWRDTNYIHDYELVDIKEKRRWLTERGLRLAKFTTDDIDRFYSYHVGKFLGHIEADLGVDYKF